MAATSTQDAPRYMNRLPGDPAPWFEQRSTSNERYHFDTTGGRYVVMCFLASTSDPRAREAITIMQANGAFFDDVNACFFGVTMDPNDEAEDRVRESLPGIRYFWDFDGTVSRLYGSAPIEPKSTQVAALQFWLVLDPTLRIMKKIPFSDGHQKVFDYLASLPPAGRFVGFEIPAPVLVLPNVFEPELCQRLISLYNGNGGEESGVMRDFGGKTVEVQNRAFKSRRDYTIEDVDLIRLLQDRIMRRVNPEILRVHSFNATRMERNIVSCYAAEDEGHFRPHRDNTTKGTAHRRFAVSINLNSEFEGGELGFPEYGPRSYKAPPGGAIVFGGSLLHAVSKVTTGRRYAYLPFVYDEAAARIREENAKFLEGEAANYKAGLAKAG